MKTNFFKKVQTFFVLLCLFLLNFSFSTYSQSSINFESGGFVTEIYPTNNPSGNLDVQTLFCRTDVGGVFKSLNNGNNWFWVGNFHNSSSPMVKSELCIQGLAIHPQYNENGGSKIIIACWGNDPNDDRINNYPSMWRSIDGGQTWSPPAQPPDCIFRGGDHFDIKIGGECIVYDLSVPSRLYCGGGLHGSESRRIFVSNDNGNTWAGLNSSSIINGHVTTIAMHPNYSQIIIVGTTTGIWKSTDSGNSFTQLTNPNNISWVHRIVINRSATPETLSFFVTWGDKNIYTNTNLGLTRYDNGIWTDLISFDSDLNPYEKSQYCALTYVDDHSHNSTKLIAGRLNRPLRWTTDNGNTWNGNYNTGGGNQLLFVLYPHPDPDPDPINLPNHQFPPAIGCDNWAFNGLGNIAQNPNFSLRQNWYSSGGAGAFRSRSGGINSDSYWSYIPFGMHIPVIYDIKFDLPNSNKVLIPIADWTMAVTSSSFSNPIFDRRITRVNNAGLNQCNYSQTCQGETYFADVTRFLFSTTIGTGYMIGFDDYLSKKPKIAFKNYYSNCDQKYGSNLEQSPSSIDRFFADGVISQVSGKMIILYGKASEKCSISGCNDLGI